MGEFVHLHLHTEYSLLDGAVRIKDLMRRIKELGMKSVAITDHGVMYGVIDFYKEAIKNDIKPIIGCELYTAPRTRFDKDSVLDSDYGHLILLAKNNTGYKNLMKLVSIAFTEGFYYKPRVDKEVLEKYSEGLIALTACLSGEIPKLLLNRKYDKALEMAKYYENVFGRGNFYLELQINGIPEQNIVNQGIVRISRETSIPLVATNDVHYLMKEDYKAHEILLCIQTGKTINDNDKMTFSENEYYLKSPEEMKNAFRDLKEALDNTVKIADNCNVEIEFGKLHLPVFNVPGNMDSYEYLEKLCEEGLEKILKKKHSKSGEDINDETVNIYKDRLKYELSVIRQMGYVDYFLIVADFIRYAKENGIMVGPGRGSAAGSIVAYSLGITNIDPIKYSLIFERFLNPDRISMPDIDIDFCYERRQEVIDYVIRKYGKDHVAQIITFGTMAARAAIRDVGRALDIPYADVDLIAKMIPFQIGMTIEKALEINPELRNKYKEDPKVFELIDMAMRLEGMPRHASIHAAGVVISKEPIMEYVPVQKNEGNATTQFTMSILEELGLLKMDFLGLRTLTVIRDAMEIVKIRRNIEIDIENINMDDENVYNMIGEGKTAGIFQLESAGMTQFMRELKPKSLEDIIAGISLYRPGPMDQIPKYIENKNNPEKIKYYHELLRNILDVTYGCMVYQEQVMEIVRVIGGYSMGRADLVRRAMAKKKHDVMEQERNNFINGITNENGNVIVKGAVRNGVDQEIANKIFDEMMDFASYAFNKSHAAAYAVVAYQTAFLKCYYPVEYMAALLNSFIGNAQRISHYINECKTMGIPVLPPDINESGLKFTVSEDGKSIRFALMAIKNVGENAVKLIVNERKNRGVFKNFVDFCERVEGREVNKRCMENLIKSGAFDKMGIARSRLMAAYENIIDSLAESKKKVYKGQISIFDMGDQKDSFEIDYSSYFPDISEYPQQVLLSMEKEILGLYMTGHPLKEYQDELKHEVTLFSYELSIEEGEHHEALVNSNIEKIIDGRNVTVGGIVISKKTKVTKNNNIMAFVTLEDMYGSMELIVFPQVYEKYMSLLEEENVIIADGKISIKEDEQPKIIVNEIRPINKKKARKLFIRFNNNSNTGSVNEKSFYALLKFFSGNTPVYLYNEKDKKVELMDKNLWVTINDCLIEELCERFGNDNIRIT